jgi:hypothetical protein
MRKRIRLALIALLLGAIPACEQNKGVYPPNLAPKTYLSIVGDTLSSTDYRKILHWWGTDPDGAIDGYLIRWSGGWTPAEGTSREYGGETYEFTRATQDTFPVPLDGTSGVRRFTVRAVDAEGLVDPGGASQSFPLHNNAPTLEWNPALPRPASGYPAVAFGFRPTDFDGRATVNRYEIWLDDDSLNARTVTDTIVGLYPEDFGSDHSTRERTFHVRAYDDARAPSNTLSHTWTVHWPQSDWLKIDQVPPTGNLANWDRQFYAAVIDSVLGPTFDRIDLYNGADFTTPEEIGPLLSLFKGVMWLTGPYIAANETKLARNLAMAEGGIREYVQNGGRMLLIGQSVLGSGGGLSNVFANEVLGIPEFFEQWTDIQDPGTGSTNIPMSTRVYMQPGGDADTLHVYNIPNFVDYFREPAAPAAGLYWVRPGVLRTETGNAIVPDQGLDPAYAAVSASYGQGKITVVATAYARLYDVLRNPEWRQTIGEGIRLFRETLQP